MIQGSEYQLLNVNALLLFGLLLRYICLLFVCNNLCYYFLNAKYKVTASETTESTVE
jgi:hypothetical protein